MNKDQSTSGFIPVFKGELYYEVAGVGKPILLIHAGVADCTMWDKQFDLFCQSYRVVRYDTRGYGLSRSETTDFSNRQDILDLLDYLKVDPAVIIGISRGGQIAIDFTLEHPERVIALVAVAAGISGYEPPPDDSERARHEFELFSHADDLWEHKAFDELADLEAHIWADGPSQPVGRASSAVSDYVRRIVSANYIRHDGQATPIPLNPLAAGRLGEIHVPTLVLVGEYDTVSAHAVAITLESEIPRARKYIVPSAAHMVPMERPEQFNQLVLEFLRREI